MRIMSVVGARPQFVKLAPISKAITQLELDHVIVHTGQHYDPLLSDIFFQDLEIPAPNAHLGVGSGSHGVQTGAIMSQLDEILKKFSPDCVLVYGDTNSTLAAAISAAKLDYPIAHLEAGLRSFNRKMPEEINRILTDHSSDLCLAPTELAMKNLANEGLQERSVLVGDVMTDVLFQTKEKINSENIGNRLTGTTENPYYIATIHRAENTDDPLRLSGVISALANADLPVRLLAHPRLIQKANEMNVTLDRGSIIVSKPLAYPELVAAVLGSSAVITDSGGLQKEAFLLKVPCVTYRTETEWVETINLGWNTLANSEFEITQALNDLGKLKKVHENPYGDGYAALSAVQEIRDRFSR